MRSHRVVALGAAIGLGVLGCQVNANVKASANGNEEASEDKETPPASSVAAAVAPQAPTSAAVASPPDACPLLCYEARGPERASLTAEEVGAVRAALEPTLSRMRSCMGAEVWRRYGSPTLNLRFAADGALADIGVDPSYGFASSCLYASDHSSQGTASLPGRKTVRCHETCTAETPRRPRRGVRKRP